MQEPISQNPVLEIPEDMTCPITSQIMTDPVMLVESGNTYEREAIIEWLQKHDTDPLTNTKVNDKTISPNRTVKRLIISFLDKYKITNPDIYDETYFPKSFIYELITAIEKNEKSRFLEILAKDNRLLKKDLKDKKNLLMLSCESASLEILGIVLNKLGNEIKNLVLIQNDNGLLIFLMVSRRLGLQGAQLMAKAMGWEELQFENLLTFSIQGGDIDIAQIALSLYEYYKPDFFNTILQVAESKSQLEIMKLLKNHPSFIKNKIEKTPPKLNEGCSCIDSSNWKANKRQSVEKFSIFNEKQLPKPDLMNVKQEKKDLLVKYILMGNLESIKKLESQGISYLLPNGDGLYPLAAAVYSMNLSLIKYIERKLKGKAAIQWTKINIAKVLANINDQFPTAILPNATYHDLGNWYKKHAQKMWCLYYDKTCLTNMHCITWVENNWIKRTESMQNNNEKINGGCISMAYVGADGCLFAPGIAEHLNVIKAIYIQLSEIKKYLESKANIAEIIENTCVKKQNYY